VRLTKDEWLWALDSTPNFWMLDRCEGAMSSLNIRDCRGCRPGEEGTPTLRVVADDKTSAEMAAGLNELVREGAWRMLAAALEAELDAYVSAAGERPRPGRTCRATSAGEAWKLRPSRSATGARGLWR
jgi:hypothetical protein